MVELTQEEMDAVIYDAREGDLATLREIFEEIDPKTLISIKDDITLSTPIHAAAGNGHLDTVIYLLSILPHEDAVKLASQANETGNTPLHWAAYNGHLKIVEHLCDQYEADPFVKNEVGHDAIYEAESNNQNEVETWFLNKYAVEDGFKVEEDGENTKITYKPGSESKEAEEQAKLAAVEAQTKNLEI
ncbi:ankyrin [Suhomyces tanzawaensis NRRL Y-17324]|uniref:Ankyrin n=1 Tax=Suhomyces tanzawaensis NRRL Y-17324 TaxID=984487 RepID=A0A1E4SCC2_9ASCO|nr:ankyrin [Suhomyces tanzawaensis NRRL Y-17324]ODV77154.1 ankyrin [Suhomyces tanzawaensis NRRL Y-17324]